MLKLGIDAGAYSVQISLLSEDNKVLYLGERAHHKQVKAAVQELLLEVAPIVKESALKVAVTGSMCHLLNRKEESVVSSPLAITTALSIFESKASSLILLGAQRTLYAEKTDGIHFSVAKNTNCSAGTGAFFEEQASRLQMKIEDISAAVKDAKSVPNIAGRCSVFSKTDMIHRMQEGVPTSDILFGLCYALVRNYKASILKNQKPKTPVYLAGGVMKNAGVLRALQDLLSLQQDEIILDEYSSYLGALGAALKAESQGEEISIADLESSVEKRTSVELKSTLAPLSSFVSKEDSPEYKTVPFVQGEEYCLGIDVGSTSINLVLINKGRQVVYFSYVRTLGKPLDIVKREIEKLHQSLPDLQRYKIAVTGSGREFIGKEIGADLVINEITAQTEGALVFHPETDTIFEIGGQDSKYMSCENGKMKDFEMNKVCAAGTGAFLEEQIAKLGVPLKDFAAIALSSNRPCALGNRCTVFIEASVNQALANGYSLEDVCAGLSYAIASNYLFRVVNQKHIGDRIAIQGGIAYNEAVVAAFRAITGKEIHVSPYFSVTGALGCASLLLHHSQLAFDAEKNRRLNALLLEKSEESYLRDYHAPQLGGKKKVVGIPRVIFLHKMFPLFNALLTNLGFEVLLSPLSDFEIVKKSQQFATAETCYPIKLIYGHVAWLLEQKVDYVLLPRLYTIKHEGSVARKDYACMYMQNSPLFMEQAFHFSERGVKLLMPEFSLQFGKKFMLESILALGPELGVPKVRMLPAAAMAFAKLLSHSERLEAIAKESLEGDEPIFVLISRVYNIIDPVLNMGIEKHLNAIGCRVVHLEHLQASVMHVEHDYPDLYWPFGQHILTGLKLVKAHKNMYPIYITNHGCGPDTALQHFFQHEMQGREYLHLEVDEHTSLVGVITRLEAFLYSLQPQEAVGAEKIVYGGGGCSSCTVCRDESSEVDWEHFDSIVIPDYGRYSELIEKTAKIHLANQNLAKTPSFLRVPPLKIHKTFDYAMNKEYYSMLVMLEELLSVLQKGVSYLLLAPIDEGSEVFGQYALLCSQELNRLGFDVTLRPFYLEDVIKREDYLTLYEDMVKMELEEQGKQSGDKSYYVLGEPFCVYKPYIRDRNLKDVVNASFTYVPFSEMLLFHMHEIDRRGEWKARIKEWEKIHDKAQQSKEGSKLYSDLSRLYAAAEGKLDFCIGDAGKYRFAKLCCLDHRNGDAAILVNSAEENTAILLKQMMSGYRKEIRIPFIQLDLDYEHQASKEDFELID